MVKPAHRVPIACFCVLVSIGPAIGFVVSQGQTQGVKNADESLRLERLTTVTQGVMAQKCYVNSVQISKGTILSIPDAVTASSCIKDDRRYGFIGIVKGQVTVLEAFSPKEVESEKSNLVKGRK
jgi:hypothetical protein